MSKEVPQKLRDLIKAIRGCKTTSEERALVQKEKALIRESFNVKLLFIFQSQILVFMDDIQIKANQQKIGKEQQLYLEMLKFYYPMTKRNNFFDKRKSILDNQMHLNCI